MSEVNTNQMLICNALDERDLLRKKIVSAIRSARFVESKRKKDPKVAGAVTVEDFEKTAKSTYQSIKDMIAYYRKLDIAITMSNANTTIKTRSGKEMTVAAAIALRKSLRGDASVDVDFDGLLISAMRQQYSSAVAQATSFDKKANMELEGYKANITGRDTTKQLDKDAIDALEKLVENLYSEMIDPIGIEKELEKLEDEHDRLVKELDTAIKISNASTYITVE